MKKTILSLVIIVSTFILVGNVNAEKSVYTYTTDYREKCSPFSKTVSHRGGTLVYYCNTKYINEYGVNYKHTGSKDYASKQNKPTVGTIYGNRTDNNAWSEEQVKFISGNHKPGNAEWS